MSSLPRGSRSSDSRTPISITGVDDTDVQQFRNFIRESKSLGCSPDDTSATSTREAVSESFVDALTKEEIEEFRKKLYSYWEQSTKSGDKPEVDESKVALHVPDPTIQHEEAVTSFEDAKSEEVPTTESVHDIGKLVLTELRNIRDAKLSEGDVGKIEVGKLRRSGNIDFTQLKKKAADLPVVTGFASTRQRRQLPILRRTDPLEIVLRIYECSDSDPAGTRQYADAMSEDQEFRKRLVVEMRIMYSQLVSASRQRIPSIIEETEFESSLSSFQTKGSTLSSRDPSLISSSGQSETAYPEDTTDSAGVPPGDDSLSRTSQGDSSSLSGLVNVPQFNIPEDAKKICLTESEKSNSTLSSTALGSDDTMSNISSLPTDTSGARPSVSSLDALVSPVSKVPPEFKIDDLTEDDPFSTLPMPTHPLPTRDAGASYLSVPRDPRISPSLDDSSENAEAESVVNRLRRERSPKADENKKATKRKAT